MTSKAATQRTDLPTLTEVLTLSGSLWYLVDLAGSHCIPHLLSFLLSQSKFVYNFFHRRRSFLF